MVKTKSDDLESQGLEIWIQKLIDDGEALDDLCSEDLKIKNGAKKGPPSG